MGVRRIVIQTTRQTAHSQNRHVCFQRMSRARRRRGLECHAADRSRQLYPILHSTGEPKQRAQILEINAALGELAPGTSCKQDLRELALCIRTRELHTSRARIPFHLGRRRFTARMIDEGLPGLAQVGDEGQVLGGKMKQSACRKPRRPGFLKLRVCPRRSRAFLDQEASTGELSQGRTYARSCELRRERADLSGRAPVVEAV